MSTESPVLPDPVPKPAEERLPTTGNVRFILTAIAVIFALVYIVVFGLNTPHVPKWLELKSASQPDSEAVTWAGCQKHGGVSRTYSGNLIICNDGAVVTILTTR